MDEDKPLFQQIATSLADQIVSGALPEGSAAPSTNALAVFHRINPATAAKGMHLLQAEGILEKRRGLGMYVTAGARKKLLARRQEAFESTYVDPLVAEAAALNLSPDVIIETVQRSIDRTFPSHEPAAESRTEDQATTEAFL